MDIQQILTLSLQQALGPTAVIYALAAIGLNVHFGYTGLLNFGQAGFMMVAGYAFVSVSVIWGEASGSAFRSPSCSRSSWPCFSECPRCACAPTTSPS